VFQTEESTNDAVWKAATGINNQWDAVRKKKGFGKGVEADAKAFIDSFANKK
jgi:hypothetical protein